MKRVLDKGGESTGKVLTLKQVHGYVAPTDTGTIRMVKSHKKLVEVDAWDKGESLPEVHIAGVNTPNEMADKITALHSAIKGANFENPTDKLSRATTGLYRASTNTNMNPILDGKDGLSDIFRSMGKTLDDIGFDNEFKTDAKTGMTSLSSEEYMRNLAQKVTTVENHLNDAGLETQRVDSFTTMIVGDNKKSNVYVSNNPLDIMTQQNISENVGEHNIGVLSASNQNKVNDFVVYTSNSLVGGKKTASVVVTYNADSKEFFHFSKPTGSEQHIKSLSNVLDTQLKSKLVKDDEHHAHYEYGSAIFNVISDRFRELEDEAKSEVATGKDALTELLMRGMTGTITPQVAKLNFPDLIAEVMKPMNDSFMKVMTGRPYMSLAPESPAHKILLGYRERFNGALRTIQEAISQFAPTKTKKKETI